MTVLCPSCGNDAEPLVQIRNLVICGACGKSLRIGTDDIAYAAKYSDIETLSMAEQATLKTQHAKLWRPEKRR